MKFLLRGTLAALVALQLAALSSALEPVVIAEGSLKQPPKQPQAVIAADGDVHLVFGIGQEVYYCRSGDAGKSFSGARAAFNIPNMSLGMRRGPRIAVAKKEIVVTAIGGAQGKGRDGDILCYRSSDDGQSWQGPTKVNDVPASAREGLHAMAAGLDGTIWCVWLDLRNKRTELYASQSRDGGATWTKNTVVYRSPGGSICECCHPSIAIGDRAVHVLFRNSLGGNRDMYLASSIDGKPFETHRLGTEHWELNACPMDGGMLCIEDSGEVSTVWRRGGLVYATHDEPAAEALLGKGEQPWVASTKSDSVAVWTGAREGELFMTALSKIEPRSIARVARDPVIASSPAGSGPLIVCWESKKDDQARIEALAIPQ